MIGLEKYSPSRYNKRDYFHNITIKQRGKIMAHNRTICTTNNVEYLDIRKAMIKGARTVEEVKEIAGVCGECEGCKSELDGILSSVCGCAGASLQDVINAIEGGANTVEKVGEVTGAGTHCGKCKGLIQNVIDMGR